MKITLRQAATFIGAACFVAVMGAGGGLGAYYMSPRAPVALKDIHLVSNIAYRGRSIVLSFTLTRNIVCDSKVDRWLWRNDANGNQQWVGLPSRANPPTAVGVSVSYQLVLPVPSEVPAGHWFYFSRSWDECPGPFGLTYRTMRDSGSVPVEIADVPSETDH